MEGEIPVLKERLASLERMGNRMGEYFLVGKWGEDQEEMFCWAMHEWPSGLLSARRGEC